jgi:hypothetical protein
MESADRFGSALRRLLRSAERFSEAAIRFGSDRVPFFKSSASLSRITRADQCRVLVLGPVHLRVLFPDLVTLRDFPCAIVGVLACRLEDNALSQSAFDRRR